MEEQKRDFDTEASTWDDNPGRVKLAGDVADAIKKRVPLDAGMDVLDFGCGTGLITTRLSPFVRSVVGADSSQGMLDVLKSKLDKQGITNVVPRHIDLDRGDKLDGTYHLIVCSMALHHVREVRPLIRLFREVLEPSGLVCIADLDQDGGKFHTSNDGVFHFGFDRNWMRDELLLAGFEDVRSRTAADILKPVPGEGVNLFTVFLMTGRNKAL